MIPVAMKSLHINMGVFPIHCGDRSVWKTHDLWKFVAKITPS